MAYNSSFRPAAGLLVLTVLTAGSFSPAQAAESQAGRVTVTEENDYFVSNDDRHYTQGARLTYVSDNVTPEGWWNKPFTAIGRYFPVFDEAGGPKRKYEWTIAGQSIFTPENTQRTSAAPRDRPYGAWLYTGVGLLQESKQATHPALENLELLGGVVGPPALGAITQNDFHQLIGVAPARGWRNEIKTEPGIMLSYERKWRFTLTLSDALALDAIPQLGATVGNVMTYGSAGGLLRFGKNLAVDYGPTHIRPSLSGTGWFDADQLSGDWGWYLFAGVQGRAVGYNIFLDGNTWRTSPHVDKKNYVADFVGGASLFYSSVLRLDFTYTQRTKEFTTQRGEPNRFGGINLAFSF